MSALQFVLLEILPVAGLAYCLWKTHGDWRQKGFGLPVIWGAAASVSAFIAVAFPLAAKVLRDLP